MEMKKESNILTEEKPKYIISLKKRYRILYIVMFVLFLVCTMYFGVISLCAGTDTMIFGIGITLLIELIANVIIGSKTGIYTLVSLKWYHAIIMITISILLTSISGLIPAKSAARMDPVNALRTE
mgnify:CR=1 FL=1